MKTNYKKMLKFAALLISSLLIATASAEVVRYMEIQGTVTVGPLKLIWIKGKDAPTATIVGSTATVSLNIENNTLVLLSEVLFLKNNDTSASYNYNISVTKALSSTYFQIANLNLYTNSSGSWQLLKTLSLNNTSSMYQSESPLGPGKYLRFEIEIKATNETSDTFKVQVTYKPSS